MEGKLSSTKVDLKFYPHLGEKRYSGLVPGYRNLLILGNIFTDCLPNNRQLISSHCVQSVLLSLLIISHRKLIKLQSLLGDVLLLGILTSTYWGYNIDNSAILQKMCLCFFKWYVKYSAFPKKVRVQFQERKKLYLMCFLGAENWS